MLAPCPDCGRSVSPHAAACPGCGRPLAALLPLAAHAAKTRAQTTMGIGALLTFGGAFAACAGCAGKGGEEVAMAGLFAFGAGVVTFAIGRSM